MHFHLKQHIKKVHKEKKSYNDQKIDENEITAKLMPNLTKNLKRHIPNIHEGQQNYKCEYCGKLFSLTGALKRHIYTVHEAPKRSQL